MERLFGDVGHYCRAYRPDYFAAGDRFGFGLSGLFPDALSGGDARCRAFYRVSAVAYFVVGVRFEHVMLGHIPTSAGEFLVLMMVILFTIGMVHVYCDKVSVERNILFYGVGVIALALGFSGFVIPFDITWILITVCVAMILYLCYVALSERVTRYFYIALFALGSMAFFYSADYVLNSVMEPHQRVRINVLLGLRTILRVPVTMSIRPRSLSVPEDYEEKAS